MRMLMMTDSLTGLFNRRYLQQRVRDELARTARYGGELSFVLIDVDLFKQINDRLGHAAGDRALGIVARAIRDSLRSCARCFEGLFAAADADLYEAKTAGRNGARIADATMYSQEISRPQSREMVA